MRRRGILVRAMTYTALAAVFVFFGFPLLYLVSTSPYPTPRLPASRRTRTFVLDWALSLRFLPPIAVVVPYFTIVRAMGLYNQLPALIIVYTIFNLPLP